MSRKELIGSEKQVVSASKIRLNVMIALQSAHLHMHEDDRMYAEVTKDWLDTVTDARFWIEMQSSLLFNPDLSQSPVFAYVCTEIGQKKLRQIASGSRFQIPELPTARKGI